MLHIKDSLKWSHCVINSKLSFFIFYFFYLISFFLIPPLLLLFSS